MEESLEQIIEAIIEEMYFPILATLAAQQAEIDWPAADKAIQYMYSEGLIRREDHDEGPYNEQTLLVVTKKGLLRANGL